MRGRALTAVALLVAARGAAARGLVVSPSWVFAGTGEPTVQVLLLRPTTREATRVAVHVLPFSVDEDGRPELSAHAGPRDATGFVSVSPSALVLDGGAAEVTVSIGIPPTDGSRWAAIVCDVEPVETRAPGGRISVLTRIVVPVVITRGSDRDRVEIRDLTVRRADSEMEMEAVLSNEGEAVERVAAEIALESGPEPAIERAADRLPPVLLFPRQIRRLHARLPLPTASADAVRLLLSSRAGIVQSSAPLPGP